MKSLFLILIIIWGAESFAHGGEDHSKPIIKITSVQHDRLMEEINKNYMNRVRPIFQRSCFDCHGNTTNYPWYYKIPGIKQLINNDIQAAKKHLDFSNDFPFKSHDTPINDLSAISKSIKNKTMPPFEYNFMHSNTELSKKDMTIIHDWIQESIEKLNSVL